MQHQDVMIAFHPTTNLWGGGGGREEEGGEGEEEEGEREGGGGEEEEEEYIMLVLAFCNIPCSMSDDTHLVRRFFPIFQVQ